MKVWPFGAALRGEASNRPGAALAEDRRGERLGKRRTRCVRWGSGRRCAVPVTGSLVKCRYALGGIKTGGFELPREESGGCPLTGQVVSGM
jgi:hypothetical protein